MFRTRAIAPAAVAAVLLLAACGSDAATGPAAGTDTPAEDTMTEDSMADEMTDDSMVDEMADDSMADEMTEDSMADEMADEMTDDSMADEMTEDSMVEHMDDDTMADDMAGLAAWQQLTLTDVAGASFTLADFVGRPVFVEHFATWCPKCRAQLADTAAAATAAGDDAVFVALSTETDLSAAAVAEYAADNGFTSVRFAVMTPEFLAAVSDELGTTSINPPSTPHYVIAADGTVGELATGSVSAEEIAAALAAAA